MNRLKNTIFLLLFSLCSHGYALDFSSKPIKQKNQIACPSRDFSEFIKAFSENTEVQMAFTKYPLREQSVNSNAEPEPKPVVQHLRRDQVLFPVMPNQDVRRKQSLEIRIDSVSNAKVTMLKPDTDYQVTYEFGFDGNACWYLLSIDDQSLRGGEEANTSWLDRIFPSMNDCTPKTFYFDKELKRSNDGFLESHGYQPYKVDEYFAKYTIREKFFGFDATEIAIPSNTYSLYTVIVQASAKNLAKAIKSQTGYAPPIYFKNKKIASQSAMAYLVPEGANKSTFVCFTSDEGGL